MMFSPTMFFHALLDPAFGRGSKNAAEDYILYNQKSKVPVDLANMAPHEVDQLFYDTPNRRYALPAAGVQAAAALAAAHQGIHAGANLAERYISPHGKYSWLREKALEAANSIPADPFMVPYQYRGPLWGAPNRYTSRSWWDKDFVLRGTTPAAAIKPESPYVNPWHMQQKMTYYKPVK